MIYLIQHKNDKRGFIMSIPDNLIPIDNPLKNIDIEVFKKNAPINYPQPKIPEPLIRPNPIHETNRILEGQSEKIDDLSKNLEIANSEIVKQTKELQSIHYENMKLNTQIDVLNKTVDSQKDELERLRNINAELKTSNKMLKENNKHYWRNTFIVGFVVAAIFFVLGYFI